MSRTQDRRRARENTRRAREAAAWQDARNARKIEVATTGATYTQGRAPTHMGLRTNGQPAAHDVTRGMAPRGTYAQDKAPSYHRQLVRAWDRDEIRWAGDKTIIVSRVRDERPAVVKAGPVGMTAARDRRVDNTPGRSTGWSDASAKAEAAFARELAIERRGW